MANFKYSLHLARGETGQISRISSKSKASVSSRKGRDGFTLIELLVSISIMVILASLMVVNLASQRIPRDMKIAQSQLVTNIREIQSNTLSSRLLPSGNQAQYYLIKFDLAKPQEYTIQGMFNVNSSPQLEDVETINLPSTIRLAASSPVVIDQSLTNTKFDPSSMSPYLQIPAGGGCAVLAFSTPFGKIFSNGACTPTNPPSPYTIIASDDYQKILNYVGNTSCAGFGSPPGCGVTTDSIITITLTDKENTVSKTVTINGVTGAVTFN